MESAQRKIKPWFWWVLFAVFLFIAWAMLLPAGTDKNKVRKMETSVQIKNLAAALAQPAVQANTSVSLNERLRRALKDTNLPYGGFIQINEAGQVADGWHTPLQIQFTTGTNFIIRSAGRDRQFGTKDDIIYDTTAGGFR